MAANDLKRLQAAVVDGRARNVFFRQTQLDQLCRKLLAQEQPLRQAMVSDSNYTPSEAIAVLHASVQAVKDAYAFLQPTEALEREYRVAHGKDASDNETPFGLVYIEPEPHTLLYSVCSPLSAAIAAGNCVAVLLENNLRELPALIRRILTEALDADTLAILSCPTKEPQALDNTMSVRRAVDDSWPKANELLSPASSSVVAVVDRTADLSLAARELVQARSLFAGRSPYAPDVVLVNEFVAKDFLDAVFRETGRNPSDRLDHQLGSAKTSEHLLGINLQGDASTGVEPGPELAQALRSNMSEAALSVKPVRSLDDAINLLDNHAGPFLAAYHFCDLGSAKYLSQFVDAEVTFINQIPRQLLIGPAAPRGRPFDVAHRFPISLFSKQRPTFVTPVSESSQLLTSLSPSDNATAQTLLKEAKKPLKAMKRSQGGGVGFFEQGFLMNASFILVSVLTLSATGAWQLWRYRSL